MAAPSDIRSPLEQEHFRAINRGTLLNHIQRVARLLDSFQGIFDQIDKDGIKFRTIGGSLSEMQEEQPQLPLDKKQ